MQVNALWSWAVVQFLGRPLKQRTFRITLLCFVDVIKGFREIPSPNKGNGEVAGI